MSVFGTTVISYNVATGNIYRDFFSLSSSNAIKEKTLVYVKVAFGQ